MDRIIVTLLLIIIAVVVLIGIEAWFSGKRNELINTSNDKITNVTNNT